MIISVRPLILILLFLASSTSFGDDCSCRWHGPFSWLTDSADLVALVAVERRHGNSVDVRIDDLVKGTEYESTIRLWGDFGDYCRADWSEFPLGSRWMVALKRIEEVPSDGFRPSTPNYSFGRKGDYALSRCGAYWLREKNGLLSGNITSVFEWDYMPDMDPVPYEVIYDFVQGRADYDDIIEHSGEVTSAEAMLRRSKKAIGRPREWE